MKKILVLTLSFFVLFSASAMAQADYSASGNLVANMSEEEFSNILMPVEYLEAQNPPEFYGIERFDETAYTAALPSSYSLKNKMTSVKNQGSCGSCWAFAANAAFEGNLKMSTGKSYDLSEQLLVSDCCSAGDCQGGYPDQVASFIKNTGVPEESCYPYEGRNSSCSQACSGWKSKAIKAASTYSVSKSENALKSAIYNHGPVHLGFQVYPDFQSYSGGIYRWNGSGAKKGGHAVTAVGWNDASGGYFIVKNSWGTGWGESGYFRIAYSQINNSVGFGQMANVFGKTNPGPNPDPDPNPNPDKNSCRGNCGGQAPGGCYCDSSCEYYGDCCSDKKQQCGF